MQVSVIIVNFNVSHFLHQCLLSVEAALDGIEGEIIVVDNHSQDDSCATVKTHFPNVILISNDKNIGFAKANNQGVNLAKGKYVLILNPDTILSEDTLKKLLLFAEKNPQIGACGVPLYDGTGKFLPESKRNIPTISSSLKKLIGLNSTYYATQLKENESGIVNVLTGAFMWLEKEKYLEVGGFDEDYFMYGEDIDLSYKLISKGYSNYYFSQNQVIHYKGESTSKDTKYLNYFYGAMRVFYKKHFKINIFEEVIILTGIKFWYWVNYFKLKFKAKSTNISPKNILYIGNENGLFEKLKNYYPKSDIKVFSTCEIRNISSKDEIEKIKKMILEHEIQEIVFDQQNLTYSKIIFYLINLSKKNLTFKIHPSNCNFLIGSNDKNSNGIITILN